MRIKTSLTAMILLLIALTFGGCGGGSSTPDSLSDSAPSAPTGLTVKQTTANSVVLSWNASSGGAFSYTVYRNGVAIGYTSQTGVSQTAASTTYTDTNRTPGTTYTYAVSASSLLGNESSNSSTVNAVTLSSVTTGTTNGGYTLQTGETIPASLTTNMISGKTFYWSNKSVRMYGQLTFPVSTSGTSLPGVYSNIAPTSGSATTNWVAAVLPVVNSMPIIVTQLSSTGDPTAVSTFNILASGSSYYVVSEVLANSSTKVYSRLYFGSTSLADAKAFAGY